MTSSMLAIIVDTWRQSRTQVVFIIMVILLVLAAVFTVGVTSKMTDENGVEHVKLPTHDGPATSLEKAWVLANVQIRLSHGNTDIDPSSKESVKAVKELLVEQAEVDAMATPPLRRGVEMMISGFAGIAFSLSMLLFIAACSGYFPNMLESGAIDIVLAKPLNRAMIYLGKYLGGLVLFAGAVAATYLIVFIGMGIRTGVWHFGIFYAMPLQVFSAGVLFAILAMFGVLFRRPTLCLIVGLVFYLVVDSMVAGLISLNRANLFQNWPTLEGAADTVETVLPNFSLLKQNAVASVLSFPSMEAKPLLVAGAWLLMCLFLGYLKFARTDY